jgi:hypothetical protein
VAELAEYILVTETITPDIPQPDLPHIRAVHQEHHHQEDRAVEQPTLTQVNLDLVFQVKASEEVILQAVLHTVAVVVVVLAELAEQAVEIPQVLAE